MSGPEWTPEPAELPVEGRPLTGGADAAGPISPAGPTVHIGINPFGAERPDPGATEQDDAAAQANFAADEEAEAAGPSKVAALVATIRAALVGLRARLADRRRRVPEVAASPEIQLRPDPGAESAPDVDPTEAAEPPPEPAAGRPWNPAGWSWETRVGVAAVFSFLILVGVLVVKKGWLGDGKLVPMKIGSHAKTDQTEPAEEPKPAGSAEAPRTASTVESSARESEGPAASGKGESPPTPIVAETPAPASPDPGRPPQRVTLPTDPPATPTPQSAPSVASVPTAGGLPEPATEVDPKLALGTSSDLPPMMPVLPENRPALPAEPGAPPDPQPEPTTAPAVPAEPASAPLPVIIPEPAPESKEAAEPPKTDAPTLPPVAAGPTEAAEPPPASPTPAPTPGPATEPPSVAAEPAAVIPAEPATPQPASPPKLEEVPASATAEAGPSPRGEGWVVLPSAGKRPGMGPSNDPGGADPVGSGGGSGRSSNDLPGGRSKVADGPPIRDDVGPASGQVGVVLHEVQPGENFWTISKQFYSSPRYYKALHKANAGQVPDIAKLYIGTVIRIPPPEALDRTLIAAPALGSPADGPALSRASSTSRSRGGGSESPNEDETGPDANPGADLPATRVRPGLRRARATEPTEAPRRPTYTVKANETLRSIARDTLDDSHRDTEIFNLNRATLGDPKSRLAAGTTLTLPADAVIGRRGR